MEYFHRRLVFVKVLARVTYLNCQARIYWARTVYDRLYPHWPSTLPKETLCFWNMRDLIMLRDRVVHGLRLVNQLRIRHNFLVLMVELCKNSSSSNKLPPLNRLNNLLLRRIHRYLSQELISLDLSIKKFAKIIYAEGWSEFIHIFS